MRLVLVAAVVCAAISPARAEETISGDAFKAFSASPERYLLRTVVLEDTFERIERGFSRIETQNYFTNDRYVKFLLGQSPYPCIGLRTQAVESGLDVCGRGDLVRVRGHLVKITESRLVGRVREGGAGWHKNDYVYVAGPLQSDYYFSVGSVEKGWGGQDPSAEMYAEGMNLRETHYAEVPAAKVNVAPGALVERGIWFSAPYGGIVDDFSELETAAGMDAATTIKFALAGIAMPPYTAKSDATSEGLNGVPVGTPVRVYGRIRTKETGKGMLVGFLLDRMTRPAPLAEATAAPAKP